MISLDTNILLPALEESNILHKPAATFLESVFSKTHVAISEFILLELYNLLRNPAVTEPRSPSEAVEICQSFRNHPHWQIIGFPSESRRFHNELWLKLAEKQFDRRRAYDWRIALSLTQQGVTDFATVNLKDFQAFGFKRVWNPLA